MSDKPASVYKIGQVAKMLGIKEYVLRFWEKEFPQLNPKRTRSGQRLYSEEDIKLIKKIMYLLYEERLSIEGAKKRLNKRDFSLEMLNRIKEELLELKKILKGV